MSNLEKLYGFVEGEMKNQAKRKLSGTNVIIITKMMYTFYNKKKEQIFEFR